MLIQLITQQPQMLGPIVRITPPWVWGLLAALLALGLSQLRSRNVSRTHMTLAAAAADSGYLLHQIYRRS
jgi:hypothetical protein